MVRVTKQWIGALEPGFRCKAALCLTNRLTLFQGGGETDLDSGYGWEQIYTEEPWPGVAAHACRSISVESE